MVIIAVSENRALKIAKENWIFRDSRNQDDFTVVEIDLSNEINWSNKTAYIGYWLGKEYQGNGIMTKVAKTLTDYAFSELNLNKVEIRAAVKNKKNRGIPERLGFVNEGCIRQAEWLYDHYVDHVVYGMLVHEWNEK